MAMVNMPQNVRTMTLDISEETRINFSAEYNSVAIRSTGVVGISEFSDRQIGDSGVLKCKAGESIIYPNLISKKHIYLIGEGTVEILVGNNLTVNPFKNGGQGGGSSGTTDYLDLQNKPKLNDIVISGNKTFADYDLRWIEPDVVANEFDESKIYNKNDYVIYEKKLYKCISEHVGVWDNSNFELKNIMSEISSDSDLDINIVSEPTNEEITASVIEIWE